LEALAKAREETKLSLIKNRALWLVAFAMAAMMIVSFAPADRASAGIQGEDGSSLVWWIDPSEFSVEDDCDNEGNLIGEIAAPNNATTPNTNSTITTADVLVVPTGGSVWICVELDAEGAGGGDADYDSVNFDSNDYGSFEEALCAAEPAGDDDEIFEDEDVCEDTLGIGTDSLSVLCNTPDLDSECQSPGGDGDVAVLFQCESTAKKTVVTIEHDYDTAAGDYPDWVEFTIFCQGEPDTVTVTATPTKVEIVPALGSVAHSEIKVVVSGGGLPVDHDTEIDFSVPKCAIDIGAEKPDGSPLTDSTEDTASATSDAEAGEIDATDSATATTFDNVWFHADYNKCTPGDVVVTVTVEVEDKADIVRTVTINVVGPPAFITATAAPSSLICGEKSTITVKVTDAIGQNVSDNTRVEQISNWGSVIAGTGATLAFPGNGPVNPLASSAAATYNGVAIAYLLTSDTHTGPYEVVAAAGGTIIAYPWMDDPYYEHEENGRQGSDDHHSDYVPGAPITTQVTVTCSQPAAPAPTVAAPATGTGSITPPNIGDAGLASSSSNGMLFVIIGATAFVLAGIASVSYARR
jgi:hypothetical protein